MANDPELTPAPQEPAPTPAPAAPAPDVASAPAAEAAPAPAPAEVPTLPAPTSAAPASAEGQAPRPPRPEGGPRSEGGYRGGQRGPGGPRGGRGGPGGMRGRGRRMAFPKDPSLVDYKNVDLLQRFLNEAGQIKPRRKTGASAKQQRLLTRAVKRARHLALLPYTAQHSRG